MARVRVDVSAAAPTLDWRDVHGPARAVLYALIGVKDPDLPSVMSLRVACARSRPSVPLWKRSSPA
jgi:hypothetical protein